MLEDQFEHGHVLFEYVVCLLVPYFRCSPRLAMELFHVGQDTSLKHLNDSFTCCLHLFAFKVFGEGHPDEDFHELMSDKSFFRVKSVF